MKRRWRKRPPRARGRGRGSLRSVRLCPVKISRARGIFLIKLLLFPLFHPVEDEEEKRSPAKNTPKKVKVEAYKLTKEQKALIKEDQLNKKLWDEAVGSLNLGPVRVVQEFIIVVTWFSEDAHQFFFLFITVEILEQGGGNVPVHLLPRSGVPARHH